MDPRRTPGSGLKWPYLRLLDISLLYLYRGLIHGPQQTLGSGLRWPYLMLLDISLLYLYRVLIHGPQLFRSGENGVKSRTPGSGLRWPYLRFLDISPLYLYRVLIHGPQLFRSGKNGVKSRTPADPGVWPEAAISQVSRYFSIVFISSSDSRTPADPSGSDQVKMRQNLGPQQTPGSAALRIPAISINIQWRNIEIGLRLTRFPRTPGSVT